MALYSRQWKPDSNTQISPRNPNTATWQGSTGGTTIKGGTAISDDLILNPSSAYDYNNSGSGFIRLNGRIRNTETFTATQVTGRMVLYQPTITANVDGAAPAGFSWQPGITSTLNATSVGEAGSGGALLAFDGGGSFTKSVAGTDIINGLVKYQAAEMRGVWRFNSASTGGTNIIGNYQAAMSTSIISTGTSTIGMLYGFGITSFTGQPNPDDGGTRPAVINMVGTGVTVSRLIPFFAPDIGYTGTVNELYQFYGEDQTDAVATRAATLRSRMLSGTGKYGLYFDGTADNVVTGNLRIGSTTAPTAALHTEGKTILHDDSVTTDVSPYNFIDIAPGETITVASGHTFRGMFFGPTMEYAGTPNATATGTLMNNTASLRATANSQAFSPFATFVSQSGLQAQSFTGITGWSYRSLLHQPNLGGIGNAGTFTSPRIAAVWSAGATLDDGVTVNDWSGLYFTSPSVVAGTIDRVTAIEIDDITSGTTRYSLRSKGANANFVHVGNAIFGVDTTPTNLISVTGQTAEVVGMERHTTSNTAGNTLTLQSGGATSGATDKNAGNLLLKTGTATGNGTAGIDFFTVVASQGAGTTDRAPTNRTSLNGSGLVSLYNSIATVSNGMPAEYATIDLTTQGAAIAATTLYAVPSSGAGMYRISWVATVTRAATVSSTLGGAGGFQVVYTDGNDSVVKTSPGTIVAGVNTNSTNSTATGTISGCYVVFALASTNIQYQIGYTSVGATTMQFNLHIKCEAM